MRSDLVIAGGGYTKLEVAYLKTPLLCLPVHKHQEKLIQDFYKTFNFNNKLKIKFNKTSIFNAIKYLSYLKRFEISNIFLKKFKRNGVYKILKIINEKKNKTKKVVAVVLARLGSTRLKRKMLRKINGKKVIDLFINRLKKCKKIDEIILATSDVSQDQVFKKISKNHKIKFFSGSSPNVLDRLNKATHNLNPEDIIVRANAITLFLCRLLLIKIL